MKKIQMNRYIKKNLNEPTNGPGVSRCQEAEEFTSQELKAS